jgi:hypothetical protein
MRHFAPFPVSVVCMGDYTRASKLNDIVTVRIGQTDATSLEMRT